MNQSLEASLALHRAGAVLCAAGCAAPAEPADSAQAKAKARGACVRASQRSPAAWDRAGKQRDALSARVREAELVITAKRQRVEELRAAQLAAERRRSELRAEQGTQPAARCRPSATSLASAGARGLHDRRPGGTQTAVESEQSREPRPHARLLWLLRRTAQRRKSRDPSQNDAARLQQLVAQIEQEPQELQRPCRAMRRREIAGLQHARAERSVARGGAHQASGERQPGTRAT